MRLLPLTLIKIHCLTNGGNIGKQAVCKQRWLSHADEKRAEIIVPDNPGKQLHLILELTDNGTPNLKSYKRVILNVN